MKTAILADIHANLTALEAVLRDIDNKGGADRYWCLGDIVDFGPDPRQCLERVRQLQAATIVGNHDQAVAGLLDIKKFPEKLVVVARWTQTQMNAEDIDYIKTLPLRVTIGDFTLTHGSPRDPVSEYVWTQQLALENISHFPTQYCLVGHTHVQLCFRFDNAAISPPDDQPSQAPGSKPAEYFKKLISENRQQPGLIHLDGDRFVINPGGVGLPRDGDPRAAYAILDSENNTIELRRVEYDVAATQKRMTDQKLPEDLIKHLGEGK